MKESGVVMLLALMMFLTAAHLTNAQQIDYKGFPQWSWKKQDSTEYYLYTPSNMKKGEKYPIALFLHGCCGQDYKATLRSAVDPPIRMWHNFGANTQSIPTYLISPKTSRGWKQHIENLKAVIDDLVNNHQGDPQRIYITGFSMGANGTWAFLDKYPNYFAAALPMGMRFTGDPDKVKHIPIWTNKGETDWYAKELNKQVAQIRKQNGFEKDSSENWVTGVNPRFTEFKGVGHGVQWIATSTQDLVGWAYSKVNDGNVYPVVYFESPDYRQEVTANENVIVKVKATDPDGSIAKIELYLDNKFYKTVTTSPFSVTFLPSKGDTKIHAKAFDNKGKVSIAETWVKLNIPCTVLTPELPYGYQGAYYEKQLSAAGNGVIQYQFSKTTIVPEGLRLDSAGRLTGIPLTSGNFKITINAKDEDGDQTTITFPLEIRVKKQEEVVVTNVKNYAGKKFPLAKLKIGALPHNDRIDDEITISNASTYEGLTLIQTDANDTLNVNDPYVTFQIDKEAKVYIAYEKLDKLYTSTIPQWLNDYSREPNEQIVAQYHYYDVYSKTFPKGIVTLPDAFEKENGVNTNYFIMVGNAEAISKIPPEINFTKVSPATVGKPYQEKLITQYGGARLKWKKIKGNLPQGISLLSEGVLIGHAARAGTYSFTVEVTDDNTNKTQQTISIQVQ